MLPRLLSVPAFHHDLVLKAIPGGIVMLKQGRYLKRYTGSKHCSVDINGKFYAKSADLKKAMRNEVVSVNYKKKRGAPRSTQPDLSSKEEPQGNEKNLSTKNKKICDYRINKVEVRQRILGMINTMKGKKELYFWTVTFPASTQDAVAYQAFNTWLTALRQRRMLRDYIWVAERQKNGTVHFHIAIPHKMSVVHANRIMRTTLTTFSKKNMVPASVYLIKRYNGIDIAKNKKTGRVTNFALKKGSMALANYLTKYVTKNDTSFLHLAWHNSRGFSALFTGITFTIAEFTGYGFHRLLKRKSVIDTDFFTFWPWIADPPLAVSRHLYDVNSYVQSVLEPSENQPSMEDSKFPIDSYQ